MRGEPAPRCATLLPAVRRWLAFVISWEFRITWIYERDIACADYLAYLCYSEDEGLELGRATVHGIACVYVEMQHRMPFSIRALQSWQRVSDNRD